MMVRAHLDIKGEWASVAVEFHLNRSEGMGCLEVLDMVNLDSGRPMRFENLKPAEQSRIESLCHREAERGVA